MVLKCGDEDLEVIEDDIRKRFECPSMDECKLYVRDSSLEIRLVHYTSKGCPRGNLVAEPCIFQSAYRRRSASIGVVRKLRKKCRFFGLEETASD